MHQMSFCLRITKETT